MAKGRHHSVHRRGSGRSLCLLGLLRRPHLLPAARGQARGLSARLRAHGDRAVSQLPADPRRRRRSSCRTADTAQAPRARDASARASTPCRSRPWPGAPLEPTGDPMLDGVGPGAYAMRADTPDLTLDGLPKIVPLRIASGEKLVTHATQGTEADRRRRRRATTRTSP